MANRFRETVQVAAVMMLAALSAGCGGDKADDETSACIPGELDCACNQGQCLAGLTCVDGACVDAVAEEDTSTESSAETSSSETSSSTDASTETNGDATSTDTSDPCTAPEVLCDNVCVNPLNDANNCGACGNVCKVVVDSGGCVAGECAPVWSECHDATVELILCPVVCQAEGFSGCVTAGCGDDQMSVYWYSGPATCEEGTLVTEGQSTVCETEPDFANGDYYRCCCAQ